MLVLGCMCLCVSYQVCKSEVYVFRLTSPAESEVVGYYCHTEVCSLTGTLRACARKQGRPGHKQLVCDIMTKNLNKLIKCGPKKETHKMAPIKTAAEGSMTINKRNGLGL